MVWGTYLEKNCPSSNGHLVDCGGVKMLARMVWGTYNKAVQGGFTQSYMMIVVYIACVFKITPSLAVSGSIQRVKMVK